MIKKLSAVVATALFIVLYGTQAYAGYLSNPTVTCTIEDESGNPSDSGKILHVHFYGAGGKSGSKKLSSAWYGLVADEYITSSPSYDHASKYELAWVQYCNSENTITDAVTKKDNIKLAESIHYRSVIMGGDSITIDLWIKNPTEHLTRFVVASERSSTSKFELNGSASGSLTSDGSLVEYVAKMNASEETSPAESSSDESGSDESDPHESDPDESESGESDPEDSSSSGTDTPSGDPGTLAINIYISEGDVYDDTIFRYRISGNSLSYDAVIRFLPGECEGGYYKESLELTIPAGEYTVTQKNISRYKAISQSVPAIVNAGESTDADFYEAALSFRKLSGISGCRLEEIL